MSQTEFLAALTLLPADATEWETLPDFIKQLTTLLECKTAERDNIRKHEAECSAAKLRLRHIMSRIESCYADILNGMGIRAGDYSLSGETLEVIQQVAAHLESLPPLLDEYASITDVSQFPVHERAKIRERQSLIEERIGEVSQALASLKASP